MASHLHVVAADGKPDPAAGRVGPASAARYLAEHHRSIAALMELGEIRALVLRCARRWDAIADARSAQGLGDPE